MRSGALKQLVAIQRKVTGSPQENAVGEVDESWEDYLTSISAEWVTLSGSALFAAQQHHSEVRGIWRIRWRDGVTARMRIVHNSLYYNVLWVPPFDRAGRKWQMDLECSEGASNG